MAPADDERFRPGQASVSAGSSSTAQLPVTDAGHGAPADTGRGGAGHEDTGVGWPTAPFGGGGAFADDGAGAARGTGGHVDGSAGAAGGGGRAGGGGGRFGGFGFAARRGRPHPAAGAGSGGPIGGGLRRLFYALLALGVVVALLLTARATNLWPNFDNPIKEKTTDRSQPALLKSIQDLNRFVAAEGNFEQVIDIQTSRSNLPEFLVNDRVLFVAAGSVEAYVDFTGLGDGSIIQSADGTTVELRLPAPQLGKPNINHEKSYVFAQQRGLLNRVSDFFSTAPAGTEQQVYQQAEQKMADAAKSSGLTDRAQENTRKMLEGMLRSLGYQTVTITFAAP